MVCSGFLAAKRFLVGFACLAQHALDFCAWRKLSTAQEEFQRGLALCFRGRVCRENSLGRLAAKKGA